MKVLFSATHAAPSMEQSALALHEFDLLGAYHTTVGFSEQGGAIRLAQAVDRLFHSRLANELRRRAISEFPGALLHTYPWWEVPRTLVSRSNRNDRLAETLLNRSLQAFDRHVAKRVGRFSALYAYNGAALASLAEARSRGVFAMYCVSDLAPSFYARIRAEEYEKHPVLLTPEQRRIDEIFDARAKSLSAEWHLADLVVMHSRFCRETYETSGLNVAKSCVVPLGFPEISTGDSPRREAGAPLRVLWAGTFTAMKGSHYFLYALKRIASTIALHAEVFGKLMLPRSMLADVDDNVRFSPSIPRSALFAAYQNSDVLVLPTLSDTFGMVVTEAMSQGLPVITTDRAGASQFIRHGENGLLVPPADSDALADALAWCAGHREELREMGRRARQTAQSWQWRDFRHALGSTVHSALHAGSRSASRTGA
jgi:glycosyltransferase involved in cell wall biosynthesis